MKLSIRGESLNPSLNCAIRRHLEFALARYHGWIDKVTFDWREVGEGGERAGILFRCELQLWLNDGETATLSATSEDLLEAMRLSVDRGSRLAARRWTASRHYSPLKESPRC